MATWAPEELDRIGAAEEIDIATERGDGSLRRWVPLWVVRVGDGVYIRSWRGAGGAWYRHTAAQGHARIRVGASEHAVAADAFDDAATQAAIDDAYRTKYAGHGSTYVLPMIADEARATTLRLTPRS
jgi:hypothetical protein